jgi:hypothetical protein
MSSFQTYVVRNRLQLTLLATLGWLVCTLCWLAFAWGQLGFFQNLVSLGIGTLVFVGVTGAMWVADQGFDLLATVLATFGGLSFALYWIGFAWSGHAPLLNLAVLALTALAWLTTVTLLLAAPGRRGC